MLSVGKSAHPGAWEVYPQDPHTYNDGRLGRHASFQTWMMSVEGAYIQAPLEGSRCAKGFGGSAADGGWPGHQTMQVPPREGGEEGGWGEAWEWEP